MLSHQAPTLVLVACGIVATWAPLAAGAPPPPDAVPPETLKAVQRVLPKGWTASVKGTMLTVRRDKKVGLYNAIGAPPRVNNTPPKPRFVEPYEITLQFRPRLVPAKYDQLRRENEAIEAKLEEMRKVMRAAGISHKFDEWLPSTPQQRALVGNYRTAQKTMPTHRLPDLFNETSSIDLEVSINPFLSFTDEEVATECHQVQEAIRKLFKPHADR